MAGYRKEFSTTAARLAYSVLDSDLGHFCKDYENGNVYQFLAEGAGAAVMRRTATANTTGESILFRLDDFVEVDANGDVGDTTANGGKLSSNTTPILRGDAAESMEIVWASSNSDIIAVSTALPVGFDGTRAVTVEITGFSGTTNAFSFTVESSWDGGALVSDTATGTASASSQNITATIAAADIADTPRRLTLMLTPAAHTTDAFDLTRVALRYFMN